MGTTSRREDAWAEDAHTRRLFARFRDGDQDSARRLFESLSADLERYVVKSWRWRSLRRQVDSQEVVSEVLRRALSGPLAGNLWRDPRRGSMLRLLRKIARDVLVDWNRYRLAACRDLPRVEFPDAAAEWEGGSASQPVSPFTSPTARARGDELLELCAEVLNEDEWRAFRAVHVEGHSSEETAEQLDRSPAAVRSLIHRARTKLAARLARDRARERGGGHV